MSSASPQSELNCPHCGAPAGRASVAPFCCGGCRAAHALLQDAGLDRYYALLDGRQTPIGEPRRDPLALVPLRDAARARSCDGVIRMPLGIQGIHCAACVWVIERLFMGREGAMKIIVNPTLGRANLIFDDATFDLDAWADALMALGYRVGAPESADATQANAASNALLIRFGIAAAIALNSMILSVAVYFGLSGGDSESLYTLFLAVNQLLAAGSIAIGAPVFIRGAWRALKSGAIHLDLPIAIGMILAFLGSTWAAWQPHTIGGASADGVYFDTLTVFVALMLLGRLIQGRVVERHRRQLLAGDGLNRLTVRRLDADGRVEIVSANAIHIGDILVLAPGDILPVAATLLDAATTVSLAWITGESEPQAVHAGDPIPAGAHHAARHAARARATETLNQSALAALFGAASTQDADDMPLATRRWRKLGAVYVAIVLSAALAGFLLWLPSGLPKAIEVAIAVLVVTCPCALGLAIPLAHQIAIGRLRDSGVFVRRASFLDRVTEIRHVLFDKTGTLTLGAPDLIAPEALDALPMATRDALTQLVSRSDHPKSRAILDALTEQAALGGPALVAFDAECHVTETPGVGLAMDSDGAWALSRADDPNSAPGTVALTYNKAVQALFGFRESLQPGARAEIDALRQSGVQIHLLSGDAPERVSAMAARLGLPEHAAHGGMRPEDKAAWITERGAEGTFMIGDGLNDALAFDAATCAATPAVDHAALPERADAYLLSPGLMPVGRILAVAHRTQFVVRAIVGGAIVWNAGVIALALLGVMTPLFAAVAMPLSSIAFVLGAVWGLRDGAIIRPTHQNPSDSADLAQQAFTNAAQGAL